MHSILILDDTPEVLDLVGNILEESGYFVVCSSESGRAIQLCKDIEFDAILCDLVLPVSKLGDLSSTHFMQQVRQMSPEIPLLAMSGIINEFKISDFNNPSIKATLAKPFHPEDLLSKVKALIQDAGRA